MYICHYSPTGTLWSPGTGFISFSLSPPLYFSISRSLCVSLFSTNIPSSYMQNGIRERSRPDRDTGKSEFKSDPERIARPPTISYDSRAYSKLSLNRKHHEKFRCIFVCVCVCVYVITENLNTSDLILLNVKEKWTNNWFKKGTVIRDYLKEGSRSRAMLVKNERIHSGCCLA